MRRLEKPSLLLRFVVLNLVLFALAVLILALTPASVSNPAVHPDQLAELGLGVVAILVANAILLRRSLGPLSTLARLMRQADLLQPHGRLEGDGPREIAALIDTFNEMLDRLERERRTSSSRTLGTQEAERKRIARELHDEIGQSLTGLLLQLKGLLEEAPDQLRPTLLEVQQTVRSNLDEVRRIVRQLRPAALDDLGLAYALAALLDTVAATNDLRITRTIERDLPELEPDSELALYRIAQESVTNVVRHGDAGMLDVSLTADASSVVLRVRDDGRGLPAGALLDEGGIRGMRERANLIGANFSLRSVPRNRTEVLVVLPRRDGDH